MDGLFIYANLNILPLGSYDIFIGMYWLEAHRVKLDYYNKTFECMDEQGNPRVVRGIPKVISVRNISSMQVSRKGCRLYVSHVLEATKNETPRLEDFHVLQELGIFFLMRFQDFLQRETLILQFTLCLE